MTAFTAVRYGRRPEKSTKRGWRHIHPWCSQLLPGSRLRNTYCQRMSPRPGLEVGHPAPVRRPHSRNQSTLQCGYLPNLL